MQTNTPLPTSADLHAPQTGPDLRHRQLLDGPWWQARIPAWSDASEATFHDPKWQIRNSVRKVSQMRDLLGDRASEAFLQEVDEAIRKAPMVMRLTPYVFSLIDWANPWEDPLRRQFIPLAREIEPNHPMSKLDSLGEQRDAPVPGLVHRYPDKVLFLALDVCPVYCRFCTRSYAIGSDTDAVDKISLGASNARWEQAFEYLRNTPQVEDVVVSGGDAYLLSAGKLQVIFDNLLAIPHIRRIRLATKGLAIMPQKITGDEKWLDTLTHYAQKARRQGVHIAVHTHANHPREITAATERSMAMLFERGITVRNQSVLQAGVNDDPDTMRTLVKRLSHVNVHPYYVYTHDMVPGVETLRTTLDTALEIEKAVRGSTAGFNTPTFVCDAEGGGGKRDAHSFEYYNRELGIAVFRSPNVDDTTPYFYFDPLRELSPEARRAWNHPVLRERIVQTAVEQAGFGPVH